VAGNAPPFKCLQGPRRAGRSPGWWHRAIPPTSRRAYRTDTRGRSRAWSGAVASRAAHGRPHGRSGDRSTGWHSEGAGEQARPRATPGIQRQEPTTDRRPWKTWQRVRAAHEGYRRTSSIAGSSGSCLRGFGVRSPGGPHNPQVRAMRPARLQDQSTLLGQFSCPRRTCPPGRRRSDGR